MATWVRMGIEIGVRAVIIPELRVSRNCGPDPDFLKQARNAPATARNRPDTGGRHHGPPQPMEETMRIATALAALALAGCLPQNESPYVEAPRPQAEYRLPYPDVAADASNAPIYDYQ